MDVLLEIICLPFTILIWIISFLLVLLFSFDMFRKFERGTKNFVDVFMDINMIIHRTTLVDLYFSVSPYVRALISLTIYYIIL